MRCPECYGTGKKLVEVKTEKGAGWSKVDCGCDGGYVASPDTDGLALSSPPPGRRTKD